MYYLALSKNLFKTQMYVVYENGRLFLLKHFVVELTGSLLSADEKSYLSNFLM